MPTAGGSVGLIATRATLAGRVFDAALMKAGKTLQAAVLIENAVQALLRKGADAVVPACTETQVALDAVGSPLRARCVDRAYYTTISTRLLADKNACTMRARGANVLVVSAELDTLAAARLRVSSPGARPWTALALRYRAAAGRQRILMARAGIQIAIRQTQTGRQAVRTSTSPSRSTIFWRMMNFCALPVTVIGNSGTKRT